MATMAMAFVPQQQQYRRAAFTNRADTSLKFKFLKDLGLEKPSWLPDFGGEKKKEETSAVAAEESEGETEDVSSEAPADE